MQLSVFDALLLVIITLEVDHIIHMGEGTGVTAELSTQTLPVGHTIVENGKFNVRLYYCGRARTA
jgi:hypothetical protein